MVEFNPSADVVWPDGPSSDPYEPDKAYVRAWAKNMESVAEAASTAQTFKGGWAPSSGAFPGGVTTDQGDYWLATDAGTVGGKAFNEGDRLVSLIDTPSTSVYASNWGRVPARGKVPIVAIDNGDGTANAIQVTADGAVEDGSMVTFQLFEPTTASPVTVSINGGTPLTVKTVSDDDASALTTRVTGIVDAVGNRFYLLNDQDVSALVAQAEAAAAVAASAVSAVTLRSVAGRTLLKALDSSTITKAWLEEGGRSGWFSIYADDTPYTSLIAADTEEGIYVALDDGGAAVREAGWHVSGINPEWFGAVSGPADGSFSTDSGAAIQAALDMSVETYAAKVVLPSGFYLSSVGHVVPSGIEWVGCGANEMWELPFFDVASVTSDRGTTICYFGNGSRDKTLDFCSAMRTSGAYRVNSNRLYTNVFDQYFEATNFTNNDASGATRATLKSFSAAVYIGEDGLSGKTTVRNIRFVPACDDGVNGPLAGYLAVNTNSYVPWDEWDVGCINLNPYTTVIEDCQFAGYWNMKGYVQSSIRFGNTTQGGRGEMCIFQRNFVQGGIAIRNGDFYPIQSKTASSVTIETNPGHRFPTSGSIWIDNVAYAYTGLTYSAVGAGTLEFTGISSTSNVLVSGDDRSILQMTNNNGTTQSAFRDNNIRDFWHVSKVERPSTAFGSQAGKYSAAIEIVGYPNRGITFENNTTYCVEPLVVLNMGGRNIFFDKGTFEEQSYRTALAGPLNPGGSAQGLVIVGPTSSWWNLWPVIMAGDLTMFGFSFSGRTNFAPAMVAPAGRRYSAFTDCYGGYRFEWQARASGDGDLIYDRRSPSKFTIASGVITAYSKHFTVDTEGAASIDDLNNIIPYSPGLDVIVFHTNNSSRDVVLKHMTGGDYQIYCKTGADTTMFSPITPVMFALLNKVWYQI